MRSNANRSGRAAEDMIAAALTLRDVEYSRQVVLARPSIYGTTLRVDFVLHNIAEFPAGVIIESKWQDAGGSVDEKYPYIVANIRAGAYALPVIVIAAGGGCRPGAVDWLREHVDDTGLHAVFTFEGFFSWLQREVTTIPVPTLFTRERSS